MPLSKDKNKERMRLARATYVQPKPVHFVQPSVLEQTPGPVQPSVGPVAQIYIRGKRYVPGSLVRMPDGRVVIAPEVDADGYTIYSD